VQFAPWATELETRRQLAAHHLFPGSQQQSDPR